jgi:anoctamin-10
VYVPFGGSVVGWVQHALNTSHIFGRVIAYGNGISNGAIDDKRTGLEMWMADVSSARRKLNPSRLRDQMFAYTVTNQIVGTFKEIGLPYIVRFVDSIRNGKHNKGHSRNASGKKKRVVFEDEVVRQGDATEKAAFESEKEGKEDREFLERVRSEVALPAYDLFVDYSEMVTQFGYVALWSTIWPLAPGGFHFNQPVLYE